MFIKWCYDATELRIAYMDKYLRDGCVRPKLWVVYLMGNDYSFRNHTTEEQRQAMQAGVQVADRVLRWNSEGYIQGQEGVAMIVCTKDVLATIPKFVRDITPRLLDRHEFNLGGRFKVVDITTDLGKYLKDFTHMTLINDNTIYMYGCCVPDTYNYNSYTSSGLQCARQYLSKPLPKPKVHKLYKYVQAPLLKRKVRTNKAQAIAEIDKLMTIARQGDVKLICRWRL